MEEGDPIPFNTWQLLKILPKFIWRRKNPNKQINKRAENMSKLIYILISIERIIQTKTLFVAAATRPKREKRNRFALNNINNFNMFELTSCSFLCRTKLWLLYAKMLFVSGKQNYAVYKIWIHAAIILCAPSFIHLFSFFLLCKMNAIPYGLAERFLQHA